MKRLLSSFLAIVILFSFCACGVDKAVVEPTATAAMPTATASTPENPKLFGQAMDCGIAWDKLAYEADHTITLEDAVRLVRNSIKISRGSDQSAFLDQYLHSYDPKQELQRYHLAELLWGVYKELEYKTLDSMAMPQIDAAYIKYETGGTYTAFDIWQCPDIKAIDECTDATGCNYCIVSYDRVTGDKLMNLFDDDTFRPHDPETVESAAETALHFCRSFEEKPRYVSVSEAGKHTIDAALYTGKTTLPDASNKKLPQWRGCNISYESMLMPGALSGCPDGLFREADADCLKNVGVNFVHLYLSWSYLQGPDYTCDSKVNLARLEYLDRIISWCMKRGIHIQLVFNDVPNINGSAVNLDQWREKSALLFSDATVRDTVTEFWRMLAHRYADIPNNYLSFNLMNECAPKDDDNYVWAFRDSVNAIWKESPGRVVVADVHGWNITGEGMSKLGCALSFHLYEPRNVAIVTKEQEDAVPGYYENLIWPSCLVNAIVYGPGASGDFPKLAGKPVVFRGDIGGATLSIRFNDLSSTDTKLRITADNKVLYNGMEKYEYDKATDHIGVADAVTVTVPKGAATLKIACSAGYAFSMSDLALTLSNGTKIPVALAMDYWHGTPCAEVTVASDGSFTSSLSLADIRKGVSLRQLVEIGKKNGVAVMVGEFGVFESESYAFGIPQKTVEAFMMDEVSLFQSLGLPWCCESVGRYALLTSAPYLKDVTYRKLDGSPYYENTEMESFYEKLMAIGR